MEEVCGQSIPQLEQGSKRAWGVKVCLLEVFSRGGITKYASASGGAGGLTPPYPTQGSFEKGKGLVLGEAKSEVGGGGVNREAVVPISRTHPPRPAVP